MVASSRTRRCSSSTGLRPSSARRRIASAQRFLLCRRATLPIDQESADRSQRDHPSGCGLPSQLAGPRGGVDPSAAARHWRSAGLPGAVPLEQLHRHRHHRRVAALLGAFLDVIPVPLLAFAHDLLTSTLQATPEGSPRSRSRRNRSSRSEGDPEIPPGPIPRQGQRREAWGG